MGNTMDMQIDLDQIMSQFEQMGGAKMMQAAETSLKAVHSIITPLAAGAIGGHVRTGRTAGSLETAPNINWESPTVASMGVGFRLKTGFVSIFLMYGTPRISPVAGLYDAFYGHDSEIVEAKVRALEELLG